MTSISSHIEDSHHEAFTSGKTSDQAEVYLRFPAKQSPCLLFYIIIVSMESNYNVCFHAIIQAGKDNGNCSSSQKLLPPSDIENRDNKALDYFPGRVSLLFSSLAHRPIHQGVPHFKCKPWLYINWILYCCFIVRLFIMTLIHRTASRRVIRHFLSKLPCNVKILCAKYTELCYLPLTFTKCP